MLDWQRPEGRLPWSDISCSCSPPLVAASPVHAAKREPCSGKKGGIDRCEGGKFVCKDRRSINLRGAFLFGQRAARRMVQQVEAGRAPGSIINMSSVNAQVTIATQTAYCVSKGGLAQLTRVMSISLAKYGIRVNAIGPGSIATDILAKVASDDAMRRTLLSRTPLLRFGQPAEIAGIAAFLASDDASYVTGETIVADGGRMALNYVVPVPESL
jgi:glucose 1-dehydrogenase